MNDLEIQSQDDLFDKVEKYYLNGGKLSEKETLIVSRWEKAYALLCKHRSKKSAVEKHAAVEKISTAQGYLDMRAAERVFTPLRKYTKEFMRLIVIESAIRDIKSCEKKLKQDDLKDIYQWRVVMDIKDRAEKRIIKAAGLEQDDPNIPDYSKLQPHQYNVDLPDAVKSMIKNIISNGVVDITQIYTKISEDAVIVPNADN